jgi:hypothetical protein
MPSVAKIMQRRWYMKEYVWGISVKILTKENWHTKRETIMCLFDHHKSQMEWDSAMKGRF